MNNKKNTIISKVINILLDVLICIFGIIILILIYCNVQTKILGNSYSSFFGYSVFEVKTGSMTGAINIGDWIVIKKSNMINLNDIVTYEKNGDFITHRVIESYKGTYITKGDANPSKDDPITQQQIVGKVVKILPSFGLLKKTIFNPIVLIALIITIYVIGYTFKKNPNVDIKDNKESINREEGFVTMIINQIVDTVKTFIKNIKEAEAEKKMSNNIINPSVDEQIKENIASATDDSKMLNNTDAAQSVNVVSYDEKYDMNEVKHEEEESTENTNEDDLSKTICFRTVPVDSSEIDKTFLEIANNEMIIDEEERKQKKIDNQKRLAEKENTKGDEKIIQNKLDNLQTKKKKCKNIIDKVILIKNEEINEIIDLLNNNEKNQTNESSIRETITKSYIDAKYYNHCGDVNVEYNTKNMTIKIEDMLDKLGNKLIKAYKGKDTEYSTKVNKYVNIFLLINQLEKANDSIDDYHARREFYEKKIGKCVPSEESKLIKLTTEYMKIQRIYKGMIEFSLKKMETNTFVLVLNNLNKKNLYGVELDHNINFSKVYSSYIVDKTYSEGIVAEDKILVLMSLLQIQIAKDMINCDFRRKYLVYVPETLYEKENKMSKLLKFMEDEDVKNCVLLLVKYDVLIKNKKAIKNLRKLGYKFAIAFDKVTVVKTKDSGIMDVAEYVFADKKTAAASNLSSSIPEDLQDKVVYEDVRSKVGDFSGE